MRHLLLVCAVPVCALFVVAGAVLIGHDTTTLVAPPEAVGEAFVRNLLASRYELAMRHVDERAGLSLSSVTLAGESLKKEVGNAEPNAADGERAAISGDSAAAVIAIRVADGAVRVRLRLSRATAGVWRVAGWDFGQS